MVVLVFVVEGFFCCGFFFSFEFFADFSVWVWFCLGKEIYRKMCCLKGKLKFCEIFFNMIFVLLHLHRRSAVCSPAPGMDAFALEHNLISITRTFYR